MKPNGKVRNNGLLLNLILCNELQIVILVYNLKSRFRIGFKPQRRNFGSGIRPFYLKTKKLSFSFFNKINLLPGPGSPEIIISI